MTYDNAALVPIDSGMLAVLDPCLIPPDVLARLIESKAVAVFFTPGGDGYHGVVGMAEEDDEDYPLMVFAQHAGDERADGSTVSAGPWHIVPDDELTGIVKDWQQQAEHMEALT